MLDEAAIVILSFVGSEIMAAVAHRYVMHGRHGWILHRDHHENHDGVFERNDLFAVFFAGIAILPMWLSSLYWPVLFWIGAGVTIYGMFYFVVHDGLVHRRWPFRHVPRRGYLRRLYQAHKLHHATPGREGGVSFGFLYAPPVRKLKSQLACQRECICESAGRLEAAGSR